MHSSANQLNGSIAIGPVAAAANGGGGGTFLSHSQQSQQPASAPSSSSTSSLGSILPQSNSPVNGGEGQQNGEGGQLQVILTLRMLMQGKVGERPIEKGIEI
jgi:hypothetical protein